MYLDFEQVMEQSGKSQFMSQYCDNMDIAVYTAHVIKSKEAP